MKKNQQTRGKHAPTQPLSKKQRKKLEKRGVEIKTRVEREKMPKEKKWFISLVAAICVMAIACASFGSILLARGLSKWFDDPYASIYDEIRLGKHIDADAVNEKFYKGNIFDFAEIEANYIPMTMDDMDAYIKGVCVNYRTFVKEMQRTTEIGLGDTVALYVTDIFKGTKPQTKAEEDANRLKIPSKMEELFGTYTGYITLVVGSELFGADFDQQLIDKHVKPVDSVREVRENGKIAADDTVCITYYFQKSKGASSTPYAEDAKNRYNWSSSYEADYAKLQERVDLSTLDERFATALVDNCTTIGETFTFVLEDYNLTGGTKESDRTSDYLVTAQVVYAIEEEVTEYVTFTVPDGYFGESDGDFYELNGKTATMYVHFLYTDDYEPATFNRQFITETLGVKVDAADEAGALAEYKAEELERLNNEIAESKKLARYDKAISHLVTKATSANLFLETNSKADQMNAAAEERITRNLLERFLAAKGAPPTTAELDEYAISLAKMQDVTVSGASEYISAIFSSEAEKMKKTELLTYCIFYEVGLKITDAELEAAYEEYMTNLVGRMRDPETHNKAYFEKLYGEDTLKSWVRRDLVYMAVGEFLVNGNSYNLK